MADEQFQQAKNSSRSDGTDSLDGEHGTPGVDEVRDGVVRQMEAQKDNAADRVESAADAVRNAARGMHNQEAWMGDLVERGADELSRLADKLRTSDLRSLLRQAEEFARRQPVLLTGAGFALGFALTRATMAGIAAPPPSKDGVITAANDQSAKGSLPTTDNNATNAPYNGGVRRDH
jgi:hypothetical protein